MAIDANDLERMATERPDECFLKGSGVLKLIGGIRQLERERDELRALWLEWLDGMYDGKDLLRRVRLAVHGPLRKPDSTCGVQPSQAQSSDAQAWQHEEDPTRVISAAQKAQALRDGGASASSVKSYRISLTRGVALTAAESRDLKIAAECVMEIEAECVTNDDRNRMAALLYRLAAAGVAPSCEWTEEDPWGSMPGTYASACGELWTFNEGGPKENNVRFCQGCGKPVKLIPFPAPASSAGEDGVDSPDQPEPKGGA